ncbi:MAG TPA: holin [Streptomyces sp.]|nr:holin [Streptomyces sp.]
MATTATPAPIEAKVKTATWAATLVGIAVTVLNALPGNSQLMGPLPAWLQAVITVVVPPLVTFLAGWAARHTPRTGTGAVADQQGA